MRSGRIIALVALVLGCALPPRSAGAQSVTLVALGGGDRAATTVGLQILQEELRLARSAAVLRAALGTELAGCEVPAECLQRVATLHRSDEVCALGIEATPNAFELGLVHLSGERVDEHAVRLEVSADGLPMALRGVLRRFVTTGRPQLADTAALLLRPEPPDAALRLDGRWIANGSVLVSGLPAGLVSVRARHDLYETGEAQVTLVAGRVQELRVVLRPGAAGPPRPGTFTWAALGAAAGLAAVAGGFGLAVAREQADFDAGPITATTLPGMLDGAAAGERYATLANVCWGLAGAAALAAAGTYGTQWWSTRRRAAELEEQRRPPASDTQAPAPSPPSASPAPPADTQGVEGNTTATSGGAL